MTGAVFHAASGLDAAVLADVQAMVRRRIVSVFVRRGLIGKDDADVMGSWEHGGGFSVDASVCIGGADRAGLAPNAALRAAVTALAPVPVIAPPQAAPANTEEEPRHRSASR